MISRRGGAIDTDRSPKWSVDVWPIRAGIARINQRNSFTPRGEPRFV